MTETKNLEIGLYLISSPIGNLSDITYRAVDLLQNVDKIYCENPLITIKLLKYYDIEKKLYKYFEHSDQKVRAKILAELKSGMKIAYLTDSGTPTISDPAFKLVREIFDSEIKVFSIPGPSSAVAALSVSSLITDKFYFYGFAAKTSVKRIKEFENIKSIFGSLIFFESSNRIEQFLIDAKQIFSKSNFVIVKELTKKFEIIKKYNFSNFDFNNNIDFLIKGELIIIIENKPQTSSRSEVEEFLKIAKSEISNKSAINIAKKLFNLPKNDIYNMLLNLE